MRHRFIALLGLATAVAASASAGPGVSAQSRNASKPWSAPRTADGKPDIQGAWSFAVITPFERPANLGDKAVLNDQEAAEFEKESNARARQDEGRQRGTAADVGRAYNDFWYDRGTRLAVTKQTSTIVDPPNGRMPALTPQGQARADARAAARKARGPADGPEDCGLAERCLVGFNAGPPFAPSVYNNNVQIVQTRDYVVIVTEMVHEARIVPLDGRPHYPSAIRPWMGDSRGRWEGDTLVVETTNFNEKNLYRGATENMKLVERFTRTAPDTLTYEFTVNDPATWVSPWTGRVPLERLTDEIYQYACHEANYGMDGILKGTRAEEQAAADKAR